MNTHRNAGLEKRFGLMILPKLKTEAACWQSELVRDHEDAATFNGEFRRSMRLVDDDAPAPQQFIAVEHRQIDGHRCWVGRLSAEESHVTPNGPWFQRRRAFTCRSRRTSMLPLNEARERRANGRHAVRC